MSQEEMWELIQNTKSFKLGFNYLEFIELNCTKFNKNGKFCLEPCEKEDNEKS
jgi:hypothetical protein